MAFMSRMPIFTSACAEEVVARVAVATIAAGRRNLSIGFGVLVGVFWKNKLALE
jgi:hypothetical protein